MQSVIIVMSLVGCNHAASECTPLPQPITHWENRAQCEQEIPARIVKPDFPIIIAKCNKKVVVAISGDPAVPTKTDEVLAGQKQVGQKQVGHKQVGEPLNIIPANGDKVATSNDNKSVVGTMMSSTKHGFVFVRQGAEKGFVNLRDGTATAYSKMRGGVRSMVSSTVKFAKRTVDATVGFVKPDGQN